jgi:hypothetical protein
MTADRIPHPSLAELSIGADENGLVLYRPHGQFVILSARKACRTCGPALMTAMPQHASHRGVHVVVKEESH